MKDITPILQALGLQDSEIKTYLKGLEAGPSTAAELSKLTKYSRQGTYTAIEALSKRGLMANVLRGKKRLYVAEPPSKLLAYAKRRDQEMHERVKDLERLAPELEMQAGGERPVVRMFEGKEGVRGIINNLRGAFASNTIEIADLDAIYRVLSKEDIEGIRKETRKSKVRPRGLYTGRPAEGAIDADRVYLPEKYSGFNANIGVYGKDKIALVTLEGKMQSVFIQSKTLADTMRIILELAMKGARKS